MSLDPGRREMFWRTVNEDAEKLITEIGDTTHEMRKLRSELAECNQIFLSLSATAQEEGKSWDYNDIKRYHLEVMIIYLLNITIGLTYII